MSAGRRRPEGWLGAGLRWLTLVIAVPAAVMCLAPLAAPWWWYGELASQGALHGALLLLPALVAWRHRAVVSGLLLAGLLTGLWPTLRHAWDERLPAPAPGAPVVRIASANLFAFNPSRDRAAEALRGMAVDAKVLIEFIPGRGDEARFADPAFPHRALAMYPKRKDGILVLSRRPLAEVRVVDDGTVPFADVTLELDGGARLRLLACHPMAPYHAFSRADWRDRQWAAIAAEAARRPGPVLVIGDLNGSPQAWRWEALETTGLRRGGGREPATWPAWLGYCGVAIDHALGRDVAMAAPEPFIIPGSDHRGIIATVAVPGPDQPSAGSPKPK